MSFARPQMGNTRHHHRTLIFLQAPLKLLYLAFNEYLLLSSYESIYLNWKAFVCFRLLKDTVITARHGQTFCGPNHLAFPMCFLSWPALLDDHLLCLGGRKLHTGICDKLWPLGSCPGGSWPCWTGDSMPWLRCGSFRLSGSPKSRNSLPGAVICAHLLLGTTSTMCLAVFILTQRSSL